MENIKSALPHKVFQADQYNFEHENWMNNSIICGIDEVGRGCLFGPIVACCVVLKPFSFHPLLCDSKILTENQRIKTAQWIKANSCYAFGIIDHRIIDMVNILEATKLAMKKAYYGITAQINQHPHNIAIDAVHLQFTPEQNVFALTKGESKSVSIAAASILAKVYRDEMVKRLSKQFPGYAFEKNKGYGAKIHINALQNKGESLLHRTSFLNSFTKEQKENNENKQQTSLFC